MKKITIAIIFILLISPSIVFTHEKEEHGGGKARFTKHFKESLFKITQKGLFSVEILIDENEYKIGKDVIGIIIHDANDADVENAEILITPLRLERKDAQLPIIKEKGGGLYIVSNLDLKSGDIRRLTIRVKKKKTEDSVIFVFPEDIKTSP